jgi:hypothetical protein
MNSSLTAVLNYEQCLDADTEWGMNEGSKYFEEKSAVQIALRKVTQRLSKLDIPYAVAGGMALFVHGLRRFTEDVDILVTSDGLKAIHRELEGLGYRLPFQGSKNLRDMESGVRIEFLIAGQFPGDGKPKPVAFPDPTAVVVERKGIQYLNLPTLVELKLASGMTNPNRVKDLADVQELIKLLTLSADFGEKLNPFVRPKYVELWSAAQHVPRRFMSLWRNKFLTLEATTIEEMVTALQQAAATLQAMRDDGVVLESPGGTADDYAYLVTTDPKVAEKYDMHDESEFWGEGQQPGAGDAT